MQLVQQCGAVGRLVGDGCGVDCCGAGGGVWDGGGRLEAAVGSRQELMLVEPEELIVCWGRCGQGW